MASTSPSAVPPTSANTSPPPPSSPSSTNSSFTSPPPNSSRPPPPQAVPSTPPPSRSLSPPPSSPPDSPPASPPPSATTAPPPIETSAAPPNLSPPPPVAASPPPHASNVPPAKNPPPSEPISPTPPPPANVRTPPSSSSPSPTPAKPPESTPSPPSHTLPPSRSESPASTNAPPPSKVPSTPSVPSTSSPPPKHAPPTHASAVGGPPPPKSSIPTEKPTAKSPNGTNKSTNGAPSHPGALVLVIGIVVGFVVISLLVMAMWFVHKRKRKETGSKVGYTMPSPYSSSQNSGTMVLRTQSPFSHNGSGSDFVYSPSEASGVSILRSWFTYEELFQATNGFSAQNLLGEGGFGCVYKGFLIDGREVAVKQLKDGGAQGEREFRAEVEIISRVHHRHLVSLVGYCISEHQRLLVYDYVPNNTLHYHLHGGGRPVIDWATRVKVAAGAARGIAYLHEDCYPRIIHRDIKSSNILLDNNFEAQVSDFGLAKLAMDSYTHVTTRVMGTFGYMAPEYATSGKLTEKSDVYSFGVVLLELITGQKPVDASRPIGEESLVEWARPLLIQALNNEDYEILVDPRLEKNYSRNEMFRMIEAAAACVRHSSAKRPQMSQVVRALDSLDDISDLCNGMKPGQSAIFNPPPPSAQIRMFQRMVSGIGSQDYSSSFFNDSQSSWRSREQDSKHHDLPK